MRLLLQDNKYAGEITLKEIVQLYRDCNGLAPMVLHLHHDSPRFIEWYKMTRAFADNLQLQQREEHDGSEYDEQEEDDIHEDGEDSAEIDEGETVYVDAQETDLDVDVDDYEFDKEEPQQSGESGEVEEDELALDNSEGVVVASADQLGAKQADRGVTEEIVEYEEDELVVVEAPAVENADESPEEDQFGVDAAIRAAEQDAAVAASAAAAIVSIIPEAAAKSEDSTPAKRSRDDDGEPNDAERQVKRKLSDAGDVAVSQVPSVVPDGGEVLEETS